MSLPHGVAVVIDTYNLVSITGGVLAVKPATRVRYADGVAVHFDRVIERREALGLAASAVERDPGKFPPDAGL